MGWGCGKMASRKARVRVSLGGLEQGMQNSLRFICSQGFVRYNFLGIKTSTYVLVFSQGLLILVSATDISVISAYSMIE